MKTLIWVAALAIAFVALGAMLKRNAGRARNRARDIRPKRPLSEHEQKMFFRLTSTFPEHIVLAQVAFSALLKSTQQATRNGYNRKMADFVLCNRSFDVIATIELDDSSHKGREREDGDRDGLLTQAGYRVLRYTQIPDTARLLADLSSKP